MRELAENLGKPPEHRIDLPATIELRDEAQRIVKACDEALRPAERETAARWLGALGPLVAGNMSLEDARARISGYLDVLDAPPICFTGRTLKAAAARYKWFPSVAELVEFFDEVVREIKWTRFQAQRVANAPVIRRSSRPKGQATDPTYIAAAENLARVKAELAQRDRQTAASRTRTPTRPNYVPNSVLDALVERARAMTPQAGGRKTGTND